MIRSFIASVLCFFTIHAMSAELVCAGGNEVFIVDTDGATAKKLWRWSGEDAADLPAEARRDFNHLDECKPLENGAKLLVCASNGGCALIDRATNRLLWRARARNAHSLSLLPHDRIVVASSLSGDHLEVFSLSGSTVPVFKTPLHSAHGLVWDEKRQCLWALGFDELRAYTLEAWESDQPLLKLKSSYPLPDKDGHDLRPVPGTNELIITTEKTVQLFDRETNSFKPHTLLGKEAGIKSVDVHPSTGRIVISSWGTAIRLLEPSGTIQFKDARPYKVRWLQ
ncbi:DUF6528 family protein [Prosthecobacter sp.]|uniref:DUF6528 family protein n=1 Tax=Prosthecobacter sp. TaxID=1965333 RepID=UPI0037841F0F